MEVLLQVFIFGDYLLIISSLFKIGSSYYAKNVFLTSILNWKASNRVTSFSFAVNEWRFS